jgi:hypothetical protein
MTDVWDRVSDVRLSDRAYDSPACWHSQFGLPAVPADVPVKLSRPPLLEDCRGSLEAISNFCAWAAQFWPCDPEHPAARAWLRVVVLHVAQLAGGLAAGLDEWEKTCQ